MKVVLNIESRISVTVDVDDDKRLGMSELGSCYDIAEFEKLAGVDVEDFVVDEDGQSKSLADHLDMNAEISDLKILSESESK